MLWRILFVGIFSKINTPFTAKLYDHSQQFVPLHIIPTSQSDTSSTQEREPKFARSKATSSAAQRPTPPSTLRVIQRDARCRDHQWLP